MSQTDSGGADAQSFRRSAIIIRDQRREMFAATMIDRIYLFGSLPIQWQSRRRAPADISQQSARAPDALVTRLRLRAADSLVGSSPCDYG